MIQKLHIYSLLATVLLLFSCSTDETDSKDANSQDSGAILCELGIVAHADASVNTMVTRTATESQEVQFNNGKHIDVFIFENGTPTGTGGTFTTNYRQPEFALATTDAGVFKFVEEPNGTTERRLYWPSSGNGLELYAWYPSRATSGISIDNTTLTHTVNQDQSLDITTSDLMWGIPTADNPRPHPHYEDVFWPDKTNYIPVELTFKHLLSKLTVKLVAGAGIWQHDRPGVIDPAKLRGARVTVGPVRPQVTITNLRTGQIGTAQGTAVTVQLLDLLTNMSLTGDNKLLGYCILPPQDMQGKLITVQLADAACIDGQWTTYVYEIPDITFQGGKEYQFTITVTPTELKVTSTKIVDWIGHDSQNRQDIVVIDTEAGTTGGTVVGTMED